MGIRKRLLGSMSIIMIVFIVTIGLISKYYQDLQKLNKTVTASYALAAAFNNVEAVALKFRVVREPISTYIKQFEDSIVNFEANLEVFNNTKGKELLDVEFQERWENINKLWKHSGGYVQGVVDILEQIKGRPLEGLFNTRAFDAISADTALFTTNAEVRKDYTMVMSLNRALTNVTTTSGILDKALFDTRVELEKQAKSKEKITSFLTVILVITSAFVALLFSILFSNVISKRINNIKKILHEISKKNLAVEIDINTKDEFQELGNYVKELINTLKEFIDSAGKSVNKVNEIKDVLKSGTNESEISLNQINQSIEDMTGQFNTLDGNIEKSTRDITFMDEEIVNIVDSVHNQSVAVESSSSAIEEMTASVSQIANLTSKKRESTDNLLKIVAQGGVSVDNTYENIQQVFEELSRIKELVEVIKNIADQTSILSMNAAIESAHAGDAGKGFSVVADEIRALSEYTSSNVKDINQAIVSISTFIESSLKASEDSSTVFEKINFEVKEFSMAMAEISSSIEELAAGGEEVLHSTEVVSELNHKVNEGANRIKDQSAMIEESMVSIQSISNDVNNSIKGISIGTGAVLESFRGINRVSGESAERVEDLTKRMNEFNIESNSISDEEVSQDVEESREEILSEAVEV